MSDQNNYNNKDDEVAVPPDSKLLRRRDTVYEDILGMMVRETEEGVKRTMKLQTVLEHDEHRRRLPYQLFKKHLNKVIQEVHFTNGLANFDKDVKYCQFFNKPTQVSCIGVDKNNLDCGENVILDIDSESTKLPFFCKVMIVNQGRVHERSAPTLVRDVCLQIGDSVTEKLFHHLRQSVLHHSINMHNISMNTSRFLELEMHAIDDPNVSFTTPRSTRARRPSWCLMEEYYSIPFYQYKGKQKFFHKGVNTYISMGYTFDETDSLYSSFNSAGVNTTVTTSQAVDTDDLVKHVKYTEYSKTELLSPYSLNNVRGNEVIPVININQNKTNEAATKPLPLPSLTTPIKRKRNKLIHLVFSDQFTNTTSIPVPSINVTDVIVKPKLIEENKDNSVITVVMSGTPRDISIRYDDDADANDEINNTNEEIYYVKDATTDTNDLINYFKSEEIRPQTPITQRLPFSDDISKVIIKPNYSRPTPSYKISETIINGNNNNYNKMDTSQKVDDTDSTKRARKKYVSSETTDIIEKRDAKDISLTPPNSNAFGRILRHRYFKKTTGKEPMRFDTLISFSPRIDSNFVSTANNGNIIPTDDLNSIDQDRNKEKTPTQTTILQSTPNAKDKFRGSRVRDTSSNNQSPLSARLSTKPPTSSKQRLNKENERIPNDKDIIDDISKLETSNDLEEENSDNELERLVNYYIKYDNIRKMGSRRSRQSKNSSIGDALSISTIEPGGENIMVDATSNINNTIDYETVTAPNEAIRNSIIKTRAVSAYPEYTRYPLITKALNRFDTTKGQNELNRSMPNTAPRSHSHDSDIVKSSSFIAADSKISHYNTNRDVIKNTTTTTTNNNNNNNNNNENLTYSIQPNRLTTEFNETIQSSRHKKKNRSALLSQSLNEYDRDLLLKNAYNDVNRNISYCPKCLKESFRQEKESQLLHGHHQTHYLHHHHRHNQEQENVNFYKTEVDPSSGVDLERRIAHLIEAENDNTRYLIRTFISPTVSRPQTSRSLNTNRSFSRPSKIGITGNHLLVENQINNLTFSEANKQKIEKYKRHHKAHPSLDQHYYRIRHDRTLKLYKEPIPVDILRQNFEDFATVTAATAQSLSESGLLLKQMNNLLTTAAEN